MDVNGLLVNGLTIMILIAGTFLAPIFIYFGYDSISQAVKIQFPHILDIFLISFSIKIVNYLLNQWITMEACRIFISVSIPTMTICNMYLNILRTIRNEPLNLRTLLFYHQLHCINQIGMKIIAGIAGTFMCIGFVVSIWGNWVIVSGGCFLPTEIYFYVLGITFIVYIIIDQTIPLVIKFNELSIEILLQWKYNVFRQTAQVRYWKKKIRAQTLVYFYYGYAKFDRDTRVNYYSSIVNNSINAMLAF